MRQVDFKNGSVLSNILQTALPMLVAQVLNLLYSIVDRIYIGRIPHVGTAALGGIGLCFPIILIVTAFTNMFGMGGSPMASMALGGGDKKKAGQIMNISFRLLVVTGAVLLILGEVFASPLLVLFGAGESTLPYALPYCRIYLLGTICSMIATGMNPFITAQGYSSVAMLTVLLGAVLNIALDPVFIFVFKMGVSGAAWATILSQAVSSVFVVWFLLRKDTMLRLQPAPDPSLLLPENRSIILNIIALGTAPFIMQFTNSLVSVVANAMLAKHGGELYISVLTIITSVRQLLDTPVFAMGEGTSPVLSYNYGARRPARIRQAIAIMVGINLTYTLIVWILIERFPAFFISIFSSDKNLLSTAIPALHLYFFAYIFQGLQHGGQTVFKALGKKGRAIFFSLLRKAILVVPLTLLLPEVFHLGADGVFMAEPISNVLGGCACFVTMLITILPELRRMEVS